MLQIVYFVLGFYATLATYFILKGKAGDRAKLHALAAPEKPDYHTRTYSGPRTLTHVQ
jgi:hypothetical protein